MLTHNRIGYLVRESNDDDAVVRSERKGQEIRKAEIGRNQHRTSRDRPVKDLSIRTASQTDFTNVLGLETLIAWARERGRSSSTR